MANYDMPGSPSNLNDLESSVTMENVISDTKNLSTESVKAVAESMGIAGLSDEAARDLSEETTYRLRVLLQDAHKFLLHAKRRKLLVEDLDFALKAEGQEPLYGSLSAEGSSFKIATGGGREIYYNEDKELDLQDLIQSPLPKIPIGVSLRAHWLAIDGSMPAIPENPPASSKDNLKESSDPLSKLKKADSKEHKFGSLQLLQKVTKLKTLETVNVKQLAKHELSVEQQLYYKEITEACVGSDESRRVDALQSLTCDPGLHQMLPRLCTFIAEGVRVNVVQHNLAILIYLMRMVKSLLENQTLFLEKYLHELIPAVITCVVAKQLCVRPEADNHWALRDFACRLIAFICKNFNSSTNNIQPRVLRIFVDHLKNDQTPIVSQYGALAAVVELGQTVIKSHVLPFLKTLSNRIDSESNPLNTAIDKIAVAHIRNLLLKNVVPALKTIKNPPDNPEDYKNDFGSLGGFLCTAVQRSRLSSGRSSGGQKNANESLTTGP